MREIITLLVLTLLVSCSHNPRQAIADDLQRMTENCQDRSPDFRDLPNYLKLENGQYQAVLRELCPLKRQPFNFGPIKLGEDPLQ